MNPNGVVKQKGTPPRHIKFQRNSKLISNFHKKSLWIWKTADKNVSPLYNFMCIASKIIFIIRQTRKMKKIEHWTHFRVTSARVSSFPHNDSRKIQLQLHCNIIDYGVGTQLIMMYRTNESTKKWGRLLLRLTNLVLKLLHMRLLDIVLELWKLIHLIFYFFRVGFFDFHNKLKSSV